MKKALLLAIAACLLFAAPVMAKEGFYIGAFVPTETLSGDAGTNVDSGTGWGLRAGVGFGRYTAVEAAYSSTKHDVTGGTSTDLKGLAGDLKLHFPLTSLDSAQIMTLEPYFRLGYAHYEASKPSTAKSDGFQWGFGIELYLFRELSINAGWTKTSVSFDTNPKTEGDIKTVDFGVMYHFI
jgi:outer membrane protein with beta-barrel domain